jgi:hypothetical protein
MKKHVCILTLLLIYPLSIMAQEGIEPEDPALLLPSVILEIEDLSEEILQIDLPEQEWEPPVEREIPLPEETLLVEEPEIDFDLLEPPPEEETETDIPTPLFVEALLGGGNVYHLICQISIYKLLDFPRYSFKFSHETLDGFDFRDKGSGYSLREELLNGNIRFQVSIMEIAIFANYEATERGFQGQGPFFSKIARLFNGGTDLLIKPKDTINLALNLESGYSTFLLTGAPKPDYNVRFPPGEFFIKSRWDSDFQIKSVLLGFTAQYKFRNILGNDFFNLHRVLTEVSLSVELPYWLNIGGRVGYFYSKHTPYLFPFEISFWGTPLDFFSFRIKGGYFVTEYDLKHILKDFCYPEMPDELEDDHGWFVYSDVQFNIKNKLIITLGADLSFHSHFPDLADNINSSTGLFSLLYKDVAILNTKAGFKWLATDIFSLTLENSETLLWESDFSFLGDFLLECSLTQREDKVGSSVSFGLETDFKSKPLKPLLNFSFYGRIARFARIILDFKDILSPVLKEDRYIKEGLYRKKPYITPGFLGTLTIQIKF